MRPATRLLAAVGRQIEPGAPTGLTGLLTHGAPRSSLIFLYSSTLRKLQKLPPHSVYRQSVEALTKHRLQIIESIQPAGFASWLDKAQFKITNFDKKQAELEPRPFSDFVQLSQADLEKLSPELKELYEKVRELVSHIKELHSMVKAVEAGEDTSYEGTSFSNVRVVSGNLEEDKGGFSWNEDPRLKGQKQKYVEIEPEPGLTLEQITELENKIGAGLLEEVIQVAQGENRLVDEMIRSRAWEDLCEKAPEGQWSYFERGTQYHTTTQKP